jgi:hypothetical protein
VGDRAKAPDCPVDRTGCDGPGSYYCDDVLWSSDCRRYFERIDAGQETPAEVVARCLHEAYEELAPRFAYTTRTASAKPWREVPMRNKRLMVAVAQRLLDDGIVSGGGT